MASQIPVFIIIIAHIAGRCCPVRKCHVQGHLYQNTIDPVGCQPAAQRRISLFIHFGTGIKDQHIFRPGTVKKIGFLDLRYQNIPVTLQGLHGFLAAMDIYREITDTAKHIADTAKPIWRKPDMSILDIVAGDIEVIDLDDTLTDYDAYYEEGEVAVEPMLEIADVDPEFPGGMESLNKYITDNLKYPQLALENNIQGKVYISFFVEKDGSVSNVRVLRDIGGGCGKEAKRVVMSMPKWKPGTRSGRPVRTQFNLPINFVRPADYQPLIEGYAPVHIYEDHSKDIRTDEVVAPNAPTQLMEVEGVKVIVK